MASELGDVELELLETTQTIMKDTVGDVAVNDAFKVEKYIITCKITNISGNIIQTDYSLVGDLVDVGAKIFKNGAYTAYTTTVADPNITLDNVTGLVIGNTIQIHTLRSAIIKPGEAWYNGFPFFMKGGQDNLFSLGIVKSLGINATVNLFTDPNGEGKVINFESLDSNLYRIVITAKEEIVTNFEDPFLKNANISESTAQKVKLIYKINVVPESIQTETPAPYTGDDASNANLINEIKITPTAGNNGELISLSIVAGSEEIDGRNIQLTIRNDSGIGNRVIPFGTVDQAAYYNGKLIDSLGNKYHINAIYNDTTPGQVIIRLDSAAGQVDPKIINDKTYILHKKAVYYGDDSSGVPTGQLFWPIAKVDWYDSTGIRHTNRIADLRTKIVSAAEFQDQTNIKFDLKLTQGGTITFEATPGSNLLAWSSNLVLMNPHGPDQTIATGSVAIVDGGAIVYDMDLITGGVISKGTLAVTVGSISGGTLLNLITSPPDLEVIRVGNIIKNASGEIAQIVSIDNLNKQIIISSSWSNTGAATIYMDSYGPTTAPKDKDIFVLAVRKGTIVYLGPIGIQSGEQNSLDSGISEAILNYVGSPNELDDTPDYTGYAGPYFITNGLNLTDALAQLDKALSDTINAPIFDERTLFPSGLVAGTAITIPLNSRNSNIQETYVASKGILEIYVNQLFKFQAIDWLPVNATQISFAFDLPNDAEVHFRKATLGGGSSGGGGGGSGSLQDAYDIGKTITALTGFPMIVDGTSGVVLWVKKDFQVDGIII